MKNPEVHHFFKIIHALRTFETFLMVFPWCFPFQSLLRLPGSDLMVTVEAKQLQMLQAGIPEGLIVDHHVTQ